MRSSHANNESNNVCAVPTPQSRVKFYRNEFTVHSRRDLALFRSFVLATVHPLSASLFLSRGPNVRPAHVPRVTPCSLPHVCRERSGRRRVPAALALMWSSDLCRLVDSRVQCPVQCPKGWAVGLTSKTSSACGSLSRRQCNSL